MRSILLGVAVVLPLALNGQQASHVVISEFATRGPTSATDEFAELYNPLDTAVSIGGWRLQYKSVTGTLWSDRAVLPSGLSIPARSFFLIVNMSYVGTVVADFSSGSWTSGTGIADNGHLRIVNNASQEVDKVGWGTAIDPEGGVPAPNHGTTPNGNSVERKARSTSTRDSLGQGGLHSLLGNGYDSNVNGSDWVTQSLGRNPQNTLSPPEPSFQSGGNGTGRISVTPVFVYAARPVSTIDFSVAQDSPYILTVIKLIVPPGWLWSQDTADVSTSGSGFASSSTGVSGDTVTITGATVSTGAGGTLTLHNLTSPASPGFSSFIVRTAVASGIPAPVVQHPSVRVLDLVPIALVHVNDSIGVPAPPYQVGAQVTVTGIVTANLSTTRTEYYLQDATAGINVFSFDPPPYSVAMGDSITVTGSILQFRGLTEIAPEFSFMIRHATGRPVPDPLVVTCSEVNATFRPDFTEPNESRLIRINGVTYNAANMTITDATGTTGIFIPPTFPPAPTQFDVVGILKQFKPGTPAPGPPYTADYEIVPRDTFDIIPHPGPVITSAPMEDSIQSTSVRIRWTTNVPSTSIVAYGTTPAALPDTVVIMSSTVNHAVTLTGLTPATVYYYQAASGDINGTNFSSIGILSTASPVQATGIMNAYFSKSVDTTIAWFRSAQGNVNLSAKLIQRINASRRSIDAALYSLSGSVGDQIAAALINAKNRGVLVRVIGEYDNINSNAYNSLIFNSVPLIHDRFDPINNGVGLHHNKFFVIDARGGAVESVWVWTGSWNPTDPGTTADYQNAVEIQDPALAQAYIMEFNEMWGSSTQTPNSSFSRFGARKLDNTPHRFVIGGKQVESYFSPSDRTTSHIISTVTSAQHSVAFNTFTFTRSDIANAIIARRLAGRDVRGLFDNNTDIGSQYNYLLANGIDIHLKTGSGLLHHKYLIVDAEHPSWNPRVLTGSHNWSNSAENQNNENTIIIADGDVANQYLQEFAARYYQFGGTDTILVGVDSSPAIPQVPELYQNFPNPFNPQTTITYSIPAYTFVELSIFDILGREVAVLIRGGQEAGSYALMWDATGYAAGAYFYRLHTPGHMIVKKLMLIR